MMKERLLMLVEVNDAGELIVPAHLLRVPPGTHLNVARNGSSLVLDASREPSVGSSVLDGLPLIGGQMSDPTMTFHREDIYDSALG